jgi:hypothetical protein
MKKEKIQPTKDQRNEAARMGFSLIENALIHEYFIPIYSFMDVTYIMPKLKFSPHEATKTANTRLE